MQSLNFRPLKQEIKPSVYKPKIYDVCISRKRIYSKSEKKKFSFRSRKQNSVMKTEAEIIYSEAVTWNFLSRIRKTILFRTLKQKYFLLLASRNYIKKPKRKADKISLKTIKKCFLHVPNKEFLYLESWKSCTPSGDKPNFAIQNPKPEYPSFRQAKLYNMLPCVFARFKFWIILCD